MAAPFLAGTARVDITPEGPVSMGGFGQRAGMVSQGVHDRLYAKALFLARGAARLLLITTDLLSIPDGLYDQVAAALFATAGIAPEAVCLTASHTHSGPDVDPAVMIASPVKPYLDRLAADLIRLGRAAMNAPREVRLSAGIGKVDFLVNRRQPDGPLDPRVLALWAVPVEGGAPLAVVFGVGCHPVCLGHDNLQISADYPGAAQKAVEDALGVENALFINLTEGNVIPSTRPWTNSLDTRGYLGGSFEDARMIGEALADAVVACVGQGGEPVDDLAVAGASVRVHPAHRGLSLWENWRRLRENRAVILAYLPAFRRAGLLNPQPIFRLWRDASDVVVARDLDETEMQRLMSAVSRYLIMAMRLANPAFRRDRSMTVQAIRLGRLRLVTLPGEVLVEVGRDWQARQEPNADAAFVVGLANGFAGYLPHPDNFAEPAAREHYETIMNALEPAATVKALDRAQALIEACL